MRVKSLIYFSVVYVFIYNKFSFRFIEDCGVSGYLCSIGYEGIFCEGDRRWV